MAGSELRAFVRLEDDHDEPAPVSGVAAVRREARRHLSDPAIRRGLVTLGVLAGLLVVVIVQVASGTGLVRLDVAAHRLGMENRWSTTWVVMKFLEVLGQRGPTAVEAFLIVGWIAWGNRSWRPVFVLTGSLVALNLFVGFLKLGFGRGKPYYGDPALFVDGMLFPSGHAGNAVLTWAIVGYLIARYARVRSPRAWLIGTAVLTTVVTLVVGVASVYYDTHWVTDLVAGWLVGGMVLQGAVLVDRAVDRYQAGRFSGRVVSLADHARERDAARDRERA
ncbi:MAG: phosphatase PAP2 family protein [Actinomycetes bacterium]